MARVDGAEDTDVVVVGGRCAGSATAIALATRGRRVIVIDGSTFPSDTLSTHLFTPSHYAEVFRVGAFQRVMDLGPPKHFEAGLEAGGSAIIGRWTAVEGIDYGACVRRPGLDMALVETAREAGAEVRERTRATGLVRDPSGRIVGIEWRDRDGATGTITARLVVGADGRHSSVAEWVGARAHHLQVNRRMMAYAYYEDRPDSITELAMQWRKGRELTTIFPCDGGVSLALLMSPADRAQEFRRDAVRAFDSTIESIPSMADWLSGSERVTKIRISYKHPSYFRHSAGPGWALTGDAGHFKDPTTAQGIRDALRFGRLLGETIAPALDDPRSLDRATRAWEEDRDRQCVIMYQFSNLLGEADVVSPIEAAAYRWFAAEPERRSEIFDFFSRKLEANRLFSPRRAVGWIRDAARDPQVDKLELARVVARDAAREVRRQREYFGYRRVRDAAGPDPAPPVFASNGAPTERSRAALPTR